MKKIIRYPSILFLLISTIAIVRFIWLSNDHLECSQKVENKRDSNGNLVTIKSHVCNEKYSF
jgi:hypothetical protein